MTDRDPDALPPSFVSGASDREAETGDDIDAALLRYFRQTVAVAAVACWIAAFVGAFLGALLGA